MCKSVALMADIEEMKNEISTLKEIINDLKGQIGILGNFQTYEKPVIMANRERSKLVYEYLTTHELGFHDWFTTKVELGDIMEGRL